MCFDVYLCGGDKDTIFKDVNTFGTRLLFKQRNHRTNVRPLVRAHTHIKWPDIYGNNGLMLIIWFVWIVPLYFKSSSFSLSLSVIVVLVRKSFFPWFIFPHVKVGMVRDRETASRKKNRKLAGSLIIGTGDTVSQWMSMYACFCDNPEANSNTV